MYTASPLIFAKHLYMAGREIKFLEIPEGVEKISAFVFAGLSNLYSVSLPKSLKMIGDGAFSGCTHLSQIFNYSSLGIEKGSQAFGETSLRAKRVSSVMYGALRQVHIRMKNDMKRTHVGVYTLLRTLRFKLLYLTSYEAVRTHEC